VKTWILPLVWYVTALSTFFAVVLLGVIALALNPLFALCLAWLGSLIAALVAGSAITSRRPEVRYSTKNQIDGLGYVHQPLSVVVHMTLLAVLVAVVVMLKS